MKKVKLALYLVGLNPTNKLSFANNVLSKMTGNLNFLTPTPPLSVLLSTINDFQMAVIASVPIPAEVKAKEYQLNKVLKMLAAYVQYTCNDDDVVALSSGFDLKASSLPKAKIFTATQGALSGTVNVECPYVDARTAYVWEIISDPINLNAWQNCGTTVNTKLTVSSLISGNKYWFRVKAITSKGEQPYCDPHMVHVV